VADDLVWFSPKPGDGVFVSAGTVHALGDNVVAFEIQQNSDVTFSLYDWDHVDAKTGQRGGHFKSIKRLHALILRRMVRPAWSRPWWRRQQRQNARDSLHCEHFWLWRLRGHPFTVGGAGVPGILVCVQGAAQVEHLGANYAVGKGDVLGLPAVVGKCTLHPHGAVTLLEIAVPD
jgi:mannose-6-phosphate isomerase